MSRVPAGADRQHATNCAPSATAGGAALSEEQQILALHARGESARSIARTLGRHRLTVSRILTRHGLANYAEDIKPRAEGDARERRCLGGCGQMFWSTWSGHRRCDRCRSGTDTGAGW